jgi:hypothetical protein
MLVVRNGKIDDKGLSPFRFETSRLLTNTSVCGAGALPGRFDEANNVRNLHSFKNHGGASASATRRVSARTLTLY